MFLPISVPIMRFLVGALALQIISVVSSNSPDDPTRLGFLGGGSSNDPTPGESSQAVRVFHFDFANLAMRLRRAGFRKNFPGDVFDFAGVDREAGTVVADLGMTIAALQDRIITERAQALPRHFPAPPLAVWKIFRLSPKGKVSPLLPTDVVDDSILEHGVAIDVTIRNNGVSEQEAKDRGGMGFLQCPCGLVPFTFVDGEPLWSLNKRIVEFVNAKALAENSQRIVYPHELKLIYQGWDLISRYGPEEKWDNARFDARLYVLFTGDEPSCPLCGAGEDSGSESE